MKEQAKSIWDECLVLIKKNLNNDMAFATWFEPTEATALQGTRLTLRLPSPFCKELYEGEYLEVLRDALRAVMGPKFDVDLLVPVVKGQRGGTFKVQTDVNLRNAQPSKPQTERKSQPAPAVKGDPISDHPSAESHIPQLNSALSFENYCVSTCNKLPWSIADSIARQPVNSNFNPFFLYGDVGVGKTHLMQAIGLYVKNMYPDKRVVFLPMKEFQRLYQVAHLRKEIPAFLQWFMRCDVLLFDDLQEIVGSEGTLNNALFPIFSHLQMHGRQLVFTCDRPPQDLKELEDRLIDRFKWGIVEKLEKPDPALRKKILTFKAKKNGLQLPSDVIDYIANTPLNSVREIEGIVLGMMIRAINLGREINLELAQELVAKAIKPSKKRAINFDMIVEAVAEKFRLPSDVIFSKSRVKDVADARMTIMFLAQRILGLSTGSIGRKLGRKHSTVIHGLKTVSTRILEDKDFEELVSDIEKNL